MFNIVLIVIMCISLALIIAFGLIIRDIRNAKYKVKEESTVEKEAEEKYLKDFPDYTIFSLKVEIEKIADILIDNEQSNRYTEALREKSLKDEDIKSLKNAVLENVEIVRYSNGSLIAKIKYRDYDYNYSMVFKLSTVSRGRVFLDNYIIYKERITEHSYSATNT